MRRFAATQCSDKTVSIAEEHLDKAPESVLAIAARDSSLAPDSVVILKHWPDANVVILQAVADCFSGKPVENLKEQEGWQLSQALDYFNLPEVMWPTGLLVRHAQIRRLDSLASKLIATIKTDFVKLARKKQEDSGAIISKMCQLESKPYAGICLMPNSGPGPEALLPFEKPLRDRLTVLAAAEFLSISFTTIYQMVKTLAANYGKDISELRSEVSKLDAKFDKLTEQQLEQTNKLQTDLFKGGRILQSQVNRRVENDISKAIKEFSKQLSKELLPLQNSLQQQQNSLEQQRERTEEVLQSQRVTAAIANLIIGGGIMALFVGLLLNILPDIFSKLSETLGSPHQVFKIGILSLIALIICSLLVNVIVKLCVQSVLNLKETWCNGRKRSHSVSDESGQPQAS